jgi:hypothetical protein
MQAFSWTGAVREIRKTLLFLKKKKQKDFYSWAGPAWASL